MSLRQKAGAVIKYMLCDGHGSVRHLATSAGATTESYNYDGYGNAHGFNPANAATSLLYTGEMYDSSASMYYLRARWYSPATGRFNRMDPFTGNNQDPQSLHKYLYCHANPANGMDPTGKFLIGLVIAIAITALLISIPGCRSKKPTQFNMVFNGSTVRIYRGENEHKKLVATFNAISGDPVPGWSKQDRGPIPPGWWWIKSSRIQLFNGSEGPAWGMGRIYINPSTTQPPNTYGRKFMYFHGGSLQRANGDPWYTAGCIKVNDADWTTIVENYLKKSSMGYMRIHVDYTGQSAYHE